MPDDIQNDEAERPATGANADLLTEIRENFRYALESWKDVRDEAAKDRRAVAGDTWDDAAKKERKDALRPILSCDELNQYCNQLINDVRKNKTGITILPDGNGATDQTARTHQSIIRRVEYDSKAQAAYVTGFENTVNGSYGFWRVNTEYVSGKSFLQRLVIKRVPNADSVLFDPNIKEADGSDAEWCFVLDVLTKGNFKRKYRNAKKRSFDVAEMKMAPDWIRDSDVTVAEYWKVIKQNRTLLLFDGQVPPKPGDDDDDEPENPDIPKKKGLALQRSLGQATLGQQPGQQPQQPQMPQQGGGEEAANAPQSQPEAVEPTAYLDEYAGAKLVKHGDDETMEWNGQQYPVLMSRVCEERKIKQYITNGIEILEEIDIQGTWIRIVACFGKELYVTEGGKTKRKFISLVRLGRDAQQLYNFFWAQEMQEAGLTPAAALMGYTGQFETDKDAWEKAHHEPRVFLQIDPIVDEATGQVLPLPSRSQFQPNFQQWEFAKEAARRAIQAAMGQSPLPTAAQRRNEKSGVALNKIDEQESQGSFHFIDNFHRAIEHTGRICDELIPIVYDTEREVGIQEKDGSHRTVRLNDPTYESEPGAGPEHYDTQTGSHAVTVTVGPAAQSERDAADQFANVLAGTPMFPQIADLVVRMKNLGPLGEQMADRLTPAQFAKPGSPQQAAAQVQQLTQQLQAVNEAAKQYEQKIQQLEFEKKANVVSNEYKLMLENLRMETQMAVAEISTKAQNDSERAQFVQDEWSKFKEQQHEKEMAAQQQAHEAAQGQAQAAAQSAQSQQDAAQQQQAAAPDASAGQSLQVNP